MMRAYGASRCRPGHNPLRVGVIAVGSVFYLQDQGYFRSRYGEAPVCKVPWMVEAFLNGQMHANRRDPDTGRWRSSYWSGRNDMAVVRSLRDGRRNTVAVHILQLHEDHGLTRGFSGYPSLPDLRLYRTRPRPSRTALLGPECEWTDAKDIKRYTTEVTLRPFHGELVLLGDAPTGERSAETRRAPADRRESATANAGAGGGSPPWASGRDDQDSDRPFWGRFVSLQPL